MAPPSHRLHLVSQAEEWGPDSSVLVSQRRLLPAELSDVAFSKTQNEWKQILFGEFCYTLHQGWLQNQAWGSLLVLMVIIIITRDHGEPPFILQSPCDGIPGAKHRAGPSAE